MNLSNLVNLDSTSLRQLIKRRQGGKELGVFDESITVGVSASVLKRLSLNSGSLVMIKDLSTNWAKPARVMVLDPPENHACSWSSQESKSTKSLQDELSTKTFPIYSLISSSNEGFDPDVAFLSPVLAFNLGVYISWLEFLTPSAPDIASNPLHREDSSGLSGLQTLASESWSYFVEIILFFPVLERPLLSSTNLRNATLPHSAKAVGLSILARHSSPHRNLTTILTNHESKPNQFRLQRSNTLQQSSPSPARHLIVIGLFRHGSSLLGWVERELLHLTR